MASLSTLSSAMSEKVFIVQGYKGFKHCVFLPVCSSSVLLSRPWNVDVVLSSQACPSEAERAENSQSEKQAILP